MFEYRYINPVFLTTGEQMKLLEGELFQIYDRQMASVVGVCKVLQDFDIDAVYQMWANDLPEKHDTSAFGSVRLFCGWGAQKGLLEYVPTVMLHHEDGHVLSDSETVMLRREKMLKAAVEHKKVAYEKEGNHPMGMLKSTNQIEKKQP